MERAKGLCLALLFATFTILLADSSAFSQAVISRWNFEAVTTTNTGTDAIVSDGSAQADSGALTAGSQFTGHHASASTVWSNPAGNGSIKSVSSNNWTTTGTPTDYYQFQFATTGYQNLSVTWDQTGSNTGPRDFKVQYSTDGTLFTDATGTNSTIQIPSGISWSTGGSPNLSTRYTLDLTSVSALNNQSAVYIRILQNSTTAINGGTVATTGTGRIDNFVVSGFIPGALNDGDGTAALVNNAGTFSGSTIFSRNSGSQTVLVTVIGLPTGTLTQVRLTVPADWTGLLAGNVTLGGAFSGSPSVSGNQITISSTSLSTTPGTIQITGLTSPNPVGALDDGNSIWIVETAKSGGTLTAIASSPHSHTIIPIQNMRTGGADGFGNKDIAGDTSELTGKTVAIQGMATVPHGVLNTTGFMSFFIQDNGYGMQVFRSGTPTTSWVLGDIIVVKGSVLNFNGGMEVSPASSTSPNFYNLGAGSLPSPVVLLNASDVNESNEGKLVQLNSVTYDSPGLTFIADSVTSQSRNKYHKSPSDSGSVWLHGANPIVGKIIPSSGNVIGVVYQRNDQVAGGRPARKIAPRMLTDLGFNPADGAGVVTISPSSRIINQVAVAETLTITGDGVSTIEGVQITIPSSWTWINSSSLAISGNGFTGASTSTSGDGSGGNPWIITITGAAVTNVNTGSLRIFNLNTPSIAGSAAFATKTRGVSGTFTSVASSPTVTVYGFRMIQSGNWSNPATWSTGSVPGATDDVTLDSLGIVVTIDVSNAQCKNLTLTGTGNDTTGGGNGPILQFSDSGSPTLTVNGSISIAGGGGTGNRGGRAQLTSNGNPNAVLIVKKNVSSSSSNQPTSGNAGLNMNEGTVKLTGATTDSLQFGAGMRLGNLEIGDGVSAKTIVTAISVANATLNARSITVKQGSTFMIGSAANTNNLSVGNTSTSGIPYLTGGILVESGATLRPQLSATGAYTANINLNGGGITNNGTLNLLSFGTLNPLTHCTYTLVVGTTGTATQAIGGTNAGTYANVTVATGDTLVLNQDMHIDDGFKMTLNGGLSETPGNTVIGAVEATRTLSQSVLSTFGGIGLEINAADAAPGSTLVRRVTGTASGSPPNSSILRYFDVTPTVNTGLNATLRFRYDGSELAGQDGSTLSLWKSTNAGLSWAQEGGTPNVGQQYVDLSAVNSFSRWTAADANHSLTVTSINVSLNTGWNLISNPVTTVNDSVRQLYPTSSFPYAFKYTPGVGYEQSYRMANRLGYWSKFPSAGSSSVSGAALTRDTIDVVTGWNMIGSISCPVDTSTITTIPAGIRQSNWFGYSSGYSPVTQLVPGKAYWVKVSQNGKIVLACGTQKISVSPTDELELLNSITVTDASGSSQTIYVGASDAVTLPLDMFELPPPAPEGALDVRFASNRMVETYSAAAAKPVEYHFNVRSTSYPITIAWNMAVAYGRTISVRDGITGAIVKSTPMNGNGSIQVTNASVGKFVLTIQAAEVPAEFSVAQSYPNPFNPTATVRYGLAKDARVVLRVYNALGQEVAAIDNGIEQAGFRTVDFRADGMASGVYFYKLEAAPVDQSAPFVQVRKMLLVK
jgi:hypothetical protein